MSHRPHSEGFVRSRSGSGSRSRSSRSKVSPCNDTPLLRKSVRCRSKSPSSPNNVGSTALIPFPPLENSMPLTLSPNLPDSLDCTHHHLSPSAHRGLFRTGVALGILAILVYIGGMLFFTFSEDIAFAVQKQSEMILHEAMLCASEYEANLCSIEQPPFMVPKCAGWKLCMTANPTFVSRTMIVSKHFAALLEGFIEDLGPASLAVVVVIILCITYAISRR